MQELPAINTDGYCPSFLIHNGHRIDKTSNHTALKFALPSRLWTFANYVLVLNFPA